MRSEFDKKIVCVIKVHKEMREDKVELKDGLHCAQSPLEELWNEEYLWNEKE